MWLFALFQTDARLAGGLALMLACSCAAIALLARRKQWAWVAYAAALLAALFGGSGLLLIIGGTQ